MNRRYDLASHPFVAAGIRNLQQQGAEFGFHGRGEFHRLGPVNIEDGRLTYNNGRSVHSEILRVTGIHTRWLDHVEYRRPNSLLTMRFKSYMRDFYGMNFSGR
jgi:hypothetical protein